MKVSLRQFLSPVTSPENLAKTLQLLNDKPPLICSLYKTVSQPAVPPKNADAAEILRWQLDMSYTILFDTESSGYAISDFDKVKDKDALVVYGDFVDLHDYSKHDMQLQEALIRKWSIATDDHTTSDRVPRLVPQVQLSGMDPTVDRARGKLYAARNLLVPSSLEITDSTSTKFFGAPMEDIYNTLYPSNAAVGGMTTTMAPFITRWMITTKDPPYANSNIGTAIWNRGSTHAWCLDVLMPHYKEIRSGIGFVYVRGACQRAVGLGNTVATNAPVVYPVHQMFAIHQPAVWLYLRGAVLWPESRRPLARIPGLFKTTPPVKRRAGFTDTASVKLDVLGAGSPLQLVESMQVRYDLKEENIRQSMHTAEVTLKAKMAEVGTLRSLLEMRNIAAATAADEYTQLELRHKQAESANVQLRKQFDDLRKQWQEAKTRLKEMTSERNKLARQLSVKTEELRVALASAEEMMLRLRGIEDRSLGKDNDIQVTGEALQDARERLALQETTIEELEATIREMKTRENDHIGEELNLQKELALARVSSYVLTQRVAALQDALNGRAQLAVDTVAQAAQKEQFAREIERLKATMDTREKRLERFTEDVTEVQEDAVASITDLWQTMATGLGSNITTAAFGAHVKHVISKLDGLYAMADDIDTGDDANLNLIKEYALKWMNWSVTNLRIEESLFNRIVTTSTEMIRKANAVRGDSTRMRAQLKTVTENLRIQELLVTQSLRTEKRLLSERAEMVDELDASKASQVAQFAEIDQLIDEIAKLKLAKADDKKTLQRLRISFQEQVAENKQLASRDAFAYGDAPSVLRDTGARPTPQRWIDGATIKDKLGREAWRTICSVPVPHAPTRGLGVRFDVANSDEAYKRVRRGGGGGHAPLLTRAIKLSYGIEEFGITDRDDGDGEEGGVGICTFISMRNPQDEAIFVDRPADPKKDAKLMTEWIKLVGFRFRMTLIEVLKATGAEPEPLHNRDVTRIRLSDAKGHLPVFRLSGDTIEPTSYDTLRSDAERFGVSRMPSRTDADLRRNVPDWFTLEMVMISAEEKRRSTGDRGAPVSVPAIFIWDSRDILSPSKAWTDKRASRFANAQSNTIQPAPYAMAASIRNGKSFKTRCGTTVPSAGFVVIHDSDVYGPGRSFVYKITKKSLESKDAASFVFRASTVAADVELRLSYSRYFDDSIDGSKGERSRLLFEYLMITPLGSHQYLLNDGEDAAL